MYKVRVCFEIDGIAEDENGNPCAAGLQITIGESEKEIPYEELIRDIDIPAATGHILQAFNAKLEDVRVITPEEYDERYGDEE